MQEFFENIGKVVTEAVETVGEKTETIVEIQKLKSQIRTMDRSNSRDYEDIGKIIYDQFQDGELIEGECKELCEEISKREEAIKDLEEQMAKVKETI